MLRKTIPPAFKFEYHVECPKCHIYSAISSGDKNSKSVQCNKCNTLVTRKATNFFIYIPLEQQMTKITSENFEVIMQYREGWNCHKNADVISDARDGRIFRSLDARNPDSINLSLTVNTDGVQLDKSTANSLWPILLYQNYLPPKIRYDPHNILLVGLHFGRNKPNISSFFFPLIKEMHEIHRAGGFKNREQKVPFLPFITHCCCDLPAKAIVQGMLQYNGQSACGYCHHPGVAIKNKQKTSTVYRYINRGCEERPRSHIEMLLTASKLSGEMDSIDGVKQRSCMASLIDFDMTHGFGIDYMHGILLGNVPKLVNFWLDSKHSDQKFHIKKKYHCVLDKRVLGIKPISSIKRVPRSMNDRGFFKANEWRCLLLYYLRYCLPGLLDMKYIHHFQLLSAATYILSQEKIPAEKIVETKQMLTKFADEFEILYGKQNVTMNLHLLRHIPDSVQQLGPLWAHSLFGFEAKNGEIAKFAKAKTNVLQQVTTKYILSHTLSPVETGNRQKPSNITVRCEDKTIKPTHEEEKLLNEHGIIHPNYRIWQRALIKGQPYTSTSYRVNKTIDYFVQLKNNQMGTVKHYIKFEECVYAFVEIFEICDTSNHLLEVTSTKSFKVVYASDIEKKMMFFDVGSKQIACSIPNKFERS